jgi:hypothetical protein
MRQPISGVIWNTLVTESGSMSLSCTFFCVTNTQLSLPRTATDVSVDSLAARKAYSEDVSESDY